MKEQYKFQKRLVAGSLVVLGALGLGGCGEDANYDGTGNSFRVEGVVNNVEDDGTVKVKQDTVQVIDASGKAVNWFPEHKGQNVFSDKFNFQQKYSKKPGGWFSCGHNVYVGEVFDESGDSIEPQTLEPGTTVEIDGKIRDSIHYQSSGKSGYCTTEDKAVYDTITVEH